MDVVFCAFASFVMRLAILDYRLERSGCSRVVLQSIVTPDIDSDFTQLVMALSC
jgi:hypothetical protein